MNKELKDNLITYLDSKLMIKDKEGNWVPASEFEVKKHPETKEEITRIFNETSKRNQTTLQKPRRTNGIFKYISRLFS